MERIEDPNHPESRGHLTRYFLAAGLVGPGDVVVDAACGIGYGADILDRRGDITYIGVDLFDPTSQHKYHKNRWFVQTDLQTWIPEVGFDVFVGFETIEHLDDYDHYVQIAKQARRFIVVSAPIIPTKHMNPYHLHDFELEDLIKIFEDDTWELFHYLNQPLEFSAIYIFSRKPIHE